MHMSLHFKSSFKLLHNISTTYLQGYKVKVSQLVYIYIYNIISKQYNICKVFTLMIITVLLLCFLESYFAFSVKEQIDRRVPTFTDSGWPHFVKNNSFNKFTNILPRHFWNYQAARVCKFLLFFYISLFSSVAAKIHLFLFLFYFYFYFYFLFLFLFLKEFTFSSLIRRFCLLVGCMSRSFINEIFLPKKNSHGNWSSIFFYFFFNFL
jgi:hypothetical protein